MLFGAAAVLLTPSPAGAHALLVDADPSSGVSLSSSPRRVTLTFTEEPDPGLSSIAVLDASGAERRRGEVEAAPGDPRTLVAALPGLPDGVYTVSWRVLSRVDGHFTAGAFAFGVGVDPSEIEAVEVEETRAPPLSASETAGRFLLYLGLAALVGAGWVGVFMAPAHGASARLASSGSLAAAAGVAVLAVAQYRAAGAGWGAFLASPVGRGVLGRIVFVAIAAGGAAAAVISRRARAGLVVAGAAGIAAAGVHVAGGHAATGALASVKIATQLVHFAAAAVWIGGLGALLFALRSASGAERGAMIGCFSRVAGLALAVVAGTGTARAVAEVGSWSGLLGTGYGRLVVAKAALLGVLALLGARNRWWNVPRGAEGEASLRRLGRGEVGIAVAVFGATAVLASLVPARSASLAAPESIELEGTDFARSTRVELEITPGFPGANEFRAVVETLRGGEEVRGVSLRLSSESAGIREATLPLRRSGEAWTASGAVVAVPGMWRVVVFVDRGADSAEVPLTFYTRCRAETAPGPAPRLLDVDVPGGSGSAQVYTDPGEPGRNEVHFTFFDEEGDELPMRDDPVIRAYAQEPADLDVRRFSEGHFLGGGDLEAGRWTFTFEGATRDGDELTVCFTDEIR